MDTGERSELIGRYRSGYDEVLSALRHVADDLDAREGDGEWSPREIVHHLADSEMTSAIRLRRLIAEDSPRIQGYDENMFARRLRYDRPIEGSLLALQGARESTATILESLDEADWARAGTHSEMEEPYSVETWLRIYADHAHDHAEQIRRAVARR